MVSVRQPQAGLGGDRLHEAGPLRAVANVAEGVVEQTRAAAAEGRRATEQRVADELRRDMRAHGSAHYSHVRSKGLGVLAQCPNVPPSNRN